MTSTLSASEWDILKEGFCIESNHIQSKNAERILKKFGYEKVSSRPPTKRRPGPKPKNSARLTEDEIHIRIEFLRLMLGEAAKDLSTTHLLSAVLGLLRLYQEKCSTGLYLSSADRWIIHNLNKNCDGSVAQMRDFSSVVPEGLPMLVENNIFTNLEPETWLSHLAESAEESIQTPWADMVEEAISQPASKLDENQLYEAIRLQLGLSIEGRSVAECEQMIENLKKKRPRKKSAKAERDSKIRLLENEIWVTKLHVKRSRNDVLRMAIPALFGIRNVLDLCRWAGVDTEIERLYTFVCFVVRGSDLNALPETLRQLDTLFPETLNRQGVSPFPALFNEEMDPAPPLIPADGQLTASAPLGRKVRKRSSNKAKKVKRSGKRRMRRKRAVAQ